MGIDRPRQHHPGIVRVMQALTVGILRLEYDGRPAAASRIHVMMGAIDAMTEVQQNIQIDDGDAWKYGDAAAGDDSEGGGDE